MDKRAASTREPEEEEVFDTPTGWVARHVRNYVEVQVGANKFSARARTASAEEGPHLWQRMASIFPQYDHYQKEADRDIPVVVVERVG
jgi:deazaflavin-dependent oxidoreductase (nitroreductase family)